MPFVIRPAEPADAPPVRDLVFAILRSYGITPDPTGLDAALMEFGIPGNGSLADLVADVGGDPVGVVALGEHTTDVGWVSKLFVSREHRRAGIGSALLARAIAEARGRGLRRVGLRTRTIFREAVRLYETAGWIRGPAPDVEGPDRTYWLVLD